MQIRLADKILGDSKLKWRRGAYKEKTRNILENEIPGMGIPKEETYNKYGDSSRKIGIIDIAKHGGFLLRIRSARISEFGSLVEGGIFLRRGGVNRFRPAIPKHGLRWRK